MTDERIDGEVEAQWARIRGRLRGELGEAAYKSWLKPLTLMGAGNGVVRISVSTNFMRDWVSNHYGERLGAHEVGRQ